MKKLIGILVGCVAIICVVAFVAIGLQGKSEDGVERDEEKFALSEEMYGHGELVEITAQEYDELVAAQKSFVVVLHMVICPAEFPVKDVAKQLADEDKIVIYSLTEEEFKKTNLAEEIRYLPSVVLMRGGELISYLDAEADEDLQCYQTVDGLRSWIGKWVK